MKEVLPASGIWTVPDLAEYLNIEPSRVQQVLTDHKIKTIPFTNRYKHRLFRLEDLKKQDTGEH